MISLKYFFALTHHDTFITVGEGYRCGPENRFGRREGDCSFRRAQNRASARPMAAPAKSTLKSKISADHPGHCRAVRICRPSWKQPTSKASPRTINADWMERDLNQCVSKIPSTVYRKMCMITCIQLGEKMALKALPKAGHNLPRKANGKRMPIIHKTSQIRERMSSYKLCRDDTDLSSLQNI